MSEQPKPAKASSVFSPLQVYLIAYNGASALGWAYVLFLTAVAYSRGDPASALWGAVGAPLTYVQTAAALEVVHSLTGLVNSPAGTAFMQVFSRLWLVWGYARAFPECQGHWSLYLMVAAWALVEVPRYLFYVFSQFKGAPVPAWLFWLRYSLFIVLYPSGITGEVLQMYTGLTSPACPALWARATLLVLALYLPGGPFMINSMWGNRVRSFKKREMDANPPPVRGLVWPITNPDTKERNSTPTNKGIWVDALRGSCPELAEEAGREKNWRFGYGRYAEESVQKSLEAPKKALNIAKDGLASAMRRFRFARDGEEMSLEDAFREGRFKGSFSTGVIEGKGWGGGQPKGGAEGLGVPYGGGDPTVPYYTHAHSKQQLQGDALVQQLNRWREWGTIEASAAEAITKVVENPKWMDLSDRYFVLLGATSAMGPLDLLLSYGANVIAVDIDRQPTWATIIKKARESRGRIFFPIKGVLAPGEVRDFNGMSDAELAGVCGANLLERTPEISNWLKTVCPGKDLTIGNYTYLDGQLHTQLSIGCDAIIQTVCAHRGKGTSIAFLCTPTDLHVIPKEAADAAAANAAAAPLWQRTISALCGALCGPRAPLRPNALPPVKTKDSTDIYYVDGISYAQGPNYALAKRLQHWRAIVQREAGHTVSSNIAPSTATLSVTSNPLFGAAYGGFHKFRPLEVMYQHTSNAVMTALLVFDLRDPDSFANPRNKLPSGNPYQLFEYGSFHGGVWRCGYKLDTLGEVCVLYFMGANYGAHISAALAVLAGVAVWVATGQPMGPY